MENKPNIKILREPLKSEADKKLYRTIQLENGLTALLISDPTILPPEDSSAEVSEDTTMYESIPSEDYEYIDGDVPMLKKDFNEDKLAACALCVGVGFFSDPRDIQGLAHFVEHMLFMGSEKYPQENEFDAFIQRKGGSSNAATDFEVTTFYIEIAEKYLLQALDIFSNFFVSPLMLKGAMQREREAVESEFAIGAPSDINRKDQLLFSLFPPGHPAKTFPWGNLKSLRDDLFNNDEKLYRAAHEFVKRHYSAHRMTVTIQARMELDQLQEYVIKTFGLIPTNKLPPLDFTMHKFTPRSKDFFGGVYYIKPLSDINECTLECDSSNFEIFPQVKALPSSYSYHTISNCKKLDSADLVYLWLQGYPLLTGHSVQLTWCMPPLINQYQSKPEDYISYMLGHEGKGSLLSYLKKKVWALGIYTGDPLGYTSMFSLFSIEVELTSDGLRHIDEVLEAIFSYITMMRQSGPSQRIFDEIKTIAETGFKFYEETDPSDNVVSLSENMQYYPPQHYITGPRLYYKYDPKSISAILQYLRPERANIVIMSNEHQVPVHYNSKEPWFGTQYRREKTPPCWMKRWYAAQPFPCFHLPESNIFITKNFNLITPPDYYIDLALDLNIDLENDSMNDIYMKMEGNAVTQTFTHGETSVTINDFRLDQPNLLRKTDHMEVWYKPDFKFHLPNAVLNFYFITPLTFKSAFESCLMDLWRDVLELDLKENIYPAEMADLWSYMTVDDGLLVTINGYNQNLHLVVDEITLSMRDCVVNLSPTLLEALKMFRGRSYHNALMEPQVLAKDVRMALTLEPYMSPRDKAQVIMNITMEDLEAFSKRFLNKMFLQMLVEGNMSWYETLNIADKVHKTLKWNPLPEPELPIVLVRQLPLGTRTACLHSLNPSSTNSIICNYYQAGAETPRLAAVLEIVTMLMEEPVFAQLRTKEQLGYSVFAMMRYTFGVLGFSITVNTQVDKFSTTYVDSRIEAFLESFSTYLTCLTEVALFPTKESLLNLKYRTDYGIQEEAERHWLEIASREYKFNRLFSEAEAIQAVMTSDINEFVNNYFSIGSKSRYRKLSIQVLGNIPADTRSVDEMPDFDYQLKFLIDVEESGAFITDIHSFKKTLPFVILTVPDTSQEKLMEKAKEEEEKSPFSKKTINL